MDRIKETIARLAKEGSVKIFVSEAALTIEAGSAEFYDKVVVTYCPEDIQIQRLVERDGISLEEAMRKIRAQMPAEENWTSPITSSIRRERRMRQSLRRKISSRSCCWIIKLNARPPTILLHDNSMISLRFQSGGEKRDHDLMVADKIIPFPLLPHRPHDHVLRRTIVMDEIEDGR